LNHRLRRYKRRTLTTELQAHEVENLDSIASFTYKIKSLFAESLLF